jgi:hypothetical protein
VSIIMVTLDGRFVDRAVHALDLTIIRHDGFGALLILLLFSEDSFMVSPSGMRGTGSTKVRAGRR